MSMKTTLSTEHCFQKNILNLIHIIDKKQQENWTLHTPNYAKTKF